MGSAARVLVVDDEHALRRLLRLYLEKEGYDVAEADNGLDALSLLRRGGIDVASVDVMLPELDGFEVVRRVRTESGVPIILITARGEETVDGREVELTRREFDLLAALMRDPDRVHTRNGLLEQVWGSTVNAADRVSHDDFTARVGTSGPDELVKLGSAFDDTAASLEQADRDQRQFLADVAHEIATPVKRRDARRRA